MNNGFKLICVLTIGLLSSCSWYVMESGERPWKSKGCTIEEARKKYGPEIVHGYRSDWLDKELADSKACCYFDNYTSYDLFLIKGPFPEKDTTKSLEALYLATFTLGIIEIVLFPVTIISKTVQSFEHQPYLFFYNSNDVLFSVVDISEKTSNLIQEQNKIANKSLHLTVGFAASR